MVSLGGIAVTLIPLMMEGKVATKHSDLVGVVVKGPFAILPPKRYSLMFKLRTYDPPGGISWKTSSLKSGGMYLDPFIVTVSPDRVVKPMGA